MKTFKQFQEAAFAIPAAAGVISKVLPAAAATIGAIGTMMQARKRGRPEGGAAKRYKTRSDKNVNKPKRKLSAAEKKLFGMQKKDTIQKGSDNFETKGLIKRGDKFTKQTTRGTSKNSDAGYTTTPNRKPFDSVKSEPTIEKPPTFTGRVDKTKGAPTPKRTTFKKENQFEDVAPTNSMGGGAIAGSVEAGDNPPVNKKKKKGEPTIIARGCMPGARGRFKGGVELLASFKKNKYT